VLKVADPGTLKFISSLLVPVPRRVIRKVPGIVPASATPPTAVMSMMGRATTTSFRGSISKMVVVVYSVDWRGSKENVFRRTKARSYGAVSMN